MILITDSKNVEFSHRCPSRPLLCIRLSLTALHVNFQDQRPWSAHTSIFPTIVRYNSPSVFVISNYDLKMLKFLVDVRKTLCYSSGCASMPCRPIFNVKQNSKHAYSPFCRWTCDIDHNHCLWSGFPISKKPKFIVDIYKDLRYAAGWLSFPWWLFKCQTSPKACIPPIFLMIVCYSLQFYLGIRNYDFKNSEISRGHP